MKLKINRACDLGSISVLPPHSRKTNPENCRSESSGSKFQVGAMGSQQQLRSQSQQSLSQSISLSQLSQSSFEENLTNDQRVGSQEKDNSRRLSQLAPILSAREDSQLQLSKTSNNAFRRWNSSSISDNRCQVSEDLEHRIRMIETSVNRLGLILDSVQNDVIQVNRITKDVSFETEGIRQKVTILENSMQQLLKGNGDIKTFLEENLKSESDSEKLKEIASAISSIPEKFEARLLKLQNDMRGVFLKESEAAMSRWESLKSKHVDHSPVMHGNSWKDAQLLIPPPLGDGQNAAAQSSQRNPVRARNTPVAPPQPASHNGWAAVSKNVPQFPRVLRPKLTDSKQNVMVHKQEAPSKPKVLEYRVIIDSDDETDAGAGASCHIVKREIGKENYLDEVQEETLRILQKARKRRRRRQSNMVYLV